MANLKDERRTHLSERQLPPPQRGRKEAARQQRLRWWNANDPGYRFGLLYDTVPYDGMHHRVHSSSIPNANGRGASCLCNRNRHRMRLMLTAKPVASEQEPAWGLNCRGSRSGLPGTGNRVPVTGYLAPGTQTGNASESRS